MSRISADNEARLRKTLADGVLLGATVLLNRLVDMGLQRSRGRSLITKAHALGLIKRLGRGQPYRYQINEDWTPPAPGTARDTHQQATALQYQGPVFGTGQLCASLGLVCGEAAVVADEDEDELPPVIGARIVDSLHRYFDEIFQRCE